MNSWDAYRGWRKESANIADATSYGMTILMEKAPDGPDVFQYLATAAPVVTTSYAQTAQDNALGYLKTAQRAGGLAPVLYRPTAAALTWAVLEPIVKWALTDIVFPYAIEQVLPRLSQGVTRLVSNIGRDTVIGGVERSGQQVTWRRVPQADACAYCRLMSQWTYENQQDAERTVTRFGYSWRDRKGRRRWHAYDTPSAAKGSKQGAGSPFHGHCRCEPVAIYGDWDDAGVPDEIEDRWDLFHSQWDDAYTWAGTEQARQRDSLWADIQARPLSSTAMLSTWKQERRDLPNLEQIALGQMRKELGIR